MKLATKRSLLVFSGFVVVIGLGLLLGYLRAQYPSPKEQCEERCRAANKYGVLEALHPPEQMAGMRDNGLRKCVCR